MATDYISRETAIKMRHACKKDCSTCDFAIEGDSWCQGELFVVDIFRVPAADVRHVVHGHYIGEYDGYADENPVYDMWYCSECGCLFEDWDEKPTYNFCPNCGCAMENEK